MNSNFAHLKTHDEQLLCLGLLAEQQEIVRRIGELFSFADSIEAHSATAQKAVERLTPAILAKAFRGELVPQALNDEPASVILQSLRSLSRRSRSTIHLACELQSTLLNGRDADKNEGEISLPLHRL